MSCSRKRAPLDGDRGEAHALRRAAGFADPADDDRRFSQAEVDLVRTVELAAGLFGETELNGFDDPVTLYAVATRTKS